MAYASPRSSNYHVYHGSRSSRGRRDSDATLTNSPEPIDRGYHRSYDQCDHQHHYHNSNQQYMVHPSHARRTHHPGSAHHRESSDAAQSTRTHVPHPSSSKHNSHRSHIGNSNSYTDDNLGYSRSHDRVQHSPLRPRRSVRFAVDDDDDDDDYEHSSQFSDEYSRVSHYAAPTHQAHQARRAPVHSTSHQTRYAESMDHEPDYQRYHEYDYEEDEDEYDHHYSPASTTSRRDHDDYVRAQLPPIAQPAVAPLPPPGSLPFTFPGFLPYPPPQKEKKAPLSKRLKQAFVAMSTNPDDIMLGKKPGRLSRQNSFEGGTKKDTYAQEERGHQPRPRGTRREYSSSADHDDAYAHENDHTRGPMISIAAPRPLHPHQYDQQQYHFVLPLYHHPPKKDKAPLSQRVKTAFAEFVRDPPLPSPPPIPPPPPSLRHVRKGKGAEGGQRRSAYGHLYDGDWKKDYPVNEGELS